MHYTVVHEQDEQIRGLQLAPVADAEGGARSGCASGKTAAVWLAGPHRTGLAQGSSERGPEGRTASKARRVDGLRRHHHGRGRTGDKQTRSPSDGPAFGGQVWLATPWLMRGRFTRFSTSRSHGMPDANSHSLKCTCPSSRQHPY